MKPTVRGVVALVALTVLRALVAEVQLWIRWGLRACAVVLALWCAWSWWLHPAITAEIDRQRAAVVSEVRDAATPDLSNARDRIRGLIDGGERK